MLPDTKFPPAVVTLALLAGALIILSPLATASVAAADDSDDLRSTVGPPVSAEQVSLSPIQSAATAQNTTPTRTETSNATPTHTATPTPIPTQTTTPTSTPTQSATLTPTRSETPIPSQTTTPSSTRAVQETDSSTRTPIDAPPGIAITNLSAPDRIRPGETYTVTAMVRNPANEVRSEEVEYRFDGSTVSNRTVALDAGESRELRFTQTADGRMTGTGMIETGTYVHGVRNQSGEGVPRYVRLTPDIDLAIEEFQSPVTAPNDRQFVVLATITNPAEKTVTREVTYRFAGTPVAEKTVTVGGGERQQVAFAVTADKIEAATAAVQRGQTYDHSISTAGGASVGDAVQLQSGSGASADSLAAQESTFPTDVREGERHTVAVTVRNVDTAAFDGQFVYRIGETTVATRSIEIPAGQRQTVEFDVSYANIERASFPLPSRTVTQSITVGNTSLASGDVTVHGNVTETAATPTPRETPTFASGPDNDTGTSGQTCERGFFDKCGGTPLDQMTLTLIGTVSSILAILYEMVRGA